MDADIYVISGAIDRDVAFTLMDEYFEAQHRENCLLVLTTYGGDPDGAYIVARFLQNFYKKFTVYEEASEEAEIYITNPATNRVGEDDGGTLIPEAKKRGRSAGATDPITKHTSDGASEQV